MALDRDELKKLLKEKGVKSLDDFNTFMREVSKEAERLKCKKEVYTEYLTLPLRGFLLVLEIG